MKIYFFLAGLFTCMLVSIFSCDKEPTIITETVTLTDTIIVNTTDTVLAESMPITLFLVRHAEDGIGTNPSLNNVGLDRAASLAHFLDQVPIDVIYSSDFNRTKETAAPTAELKQLPVEIYNVGNLQGFKEDLLANHKNKTVLVVGHSNTTPTLVNLLTNTTNYANFNEQEYDNIFLLKVPVSGATEVLHFKYGEPTITR